jgi:hypothetical protein
VLPPKFDPPSSFGGSPGDKPMDVTTYIVAAAVAAITLVIRYIVTRFTHSGNVRVSDAETVFKASESVRNDLADELKACRKDRDHYAELLDKCLEAKNAK